MDIMESSSVPPGFRFRPTEEELVGYYLHRKVNSQKIDLDVITDIDLYRIEPWDIQDRCKLGNEVEEQNEWYFFSHKDRKYPTGTRTNRATTAGFWKATGRDKAVFSSKDNHQDKLIGMRKTLVFYQGRAPNGRKSDFIMHEYRLQSSQHEPTQEEGWVVCRAFKKTSPISHKQAGFEAWNNPNYYARSSSISDNTNHYRLPSSSFPTASNISEIIRNNKDNLDDLLNQSGTSSCSLINQLPLSFPLESLINSGLGHMVELPKLDSPSISTSTFTTNDNNNFDQSGIVANDTNEDDEKINFGNYLYSEWKSFDKLLASPPDITGASTSYAYVNIYDEVHELDAHTHISHALDQCFPDEL